jgi:hypothetical protein
MLPRTKAQSSIAFDKAPFSALQGGSSAFNTKALA